MKFEKDEAASDASSRAVDLFSRWCDGVLLPGDFKKAVEELNPEALFALDKLMSEHISERMKLDLSPKFFWRRGDTPKSS